MTSLLPTTARILRARADAEIAASVIAPYYGLDAAIAVNPVLPSLRQGMPAALRDAAPALGARGGVSEQWARERFDAGRISRTELARALRERLDADHPAVGESDATLVARFLAGAGAVAEPPVADAVADAAEQAALGVDERVTSWCRAALAPEAAAWPVPVAELGFYGAWRAVAATDLTLPREARRRIEQAPLAADAALAAALEASGLPQADRAEALRRELARTPGFTAHVRWLAETRGDVEIVDLLAVRLTLRLALDAPLPSPAATLARPRRPRRDELGLDAVDRALVWQSALEARVHGRLLSRVRPEPPTPAASPAAHLVFCIDVRSEGIRRHLEQQGPYATSGFAGFFGIAAEVEPLAASAASAACPVLLSPRYRVSERPVPGAWRGAKGLVDRLAGGRAWRSALKAPDAVAGAPLGWAEMTGWLWGPVAATRSILAGAAGRDRRPDEPATAPATLFDVDSALTIDDQLDTAEVILRTMGMTAPDAPLVVLVGHGSTTVNNAFRTALDCGACGGHRGAPNARIAAAILNSEAVRAGLAERGIVIPAETVFLAGEHDTVSDALRIVDASALPASRRGELDTLLADAARAADALQRERAAELPGAARRGGRGRARLERRGRDWAQVYPEWGLARNAAIVIGPRSRTAGVDLERRAFLHSYDPVADADGRALETILTAPLVVAHWINAQYYFSAVDPDVLGAGSKTVHNLVGGAGVLAGPGGDLRIGLPWQSIGTRAGLHHEPLRLLAVVDAPLPRIDDIIQRADIVADLVFGDWVLLVAPGAEPGTWVRRTREGWQPYALDASMHTEEGAPGAAPQTTDRKEAA
ncbi:putative inorganic carbon transporter subunit DabA [Microcella alkalica]|uniref:putative inorganic carbon transporter subunit DabA n=1 Tax=Microcella alkalica TaxID=355930 RepID=UPI00145D1AA7|nr:putative inorganic carbon transporter subunit DabA [Microcella alkalica]